MGSKKQGFTLLELLIVLVVMALLATLLVPVFVQAQQKARSATCVNNLRELAHAVAMYAKDYDGCAPGVAHPWADMEWAGSWPTNKYVSWQSALDPYLRSRAAFTCPNAEKINTVSADGAGVMRGPEVAFPDDWGGVELSYAFNVVLQFNTRMQGVDDLYDPIFPNSWFNCYAMSPGPNQGGMDPATGWGGSNYSRLRQPKQVIMVADANNPVELCYEKANITELCPDPNSEYCGLSYFTADPALARHNGGNNWAYADGRVKWVPFDKYSCHIADNGTGANYTATDAEILSGDTLQKAHGLDQLN